MVMPPHWPWAWPCSPPSPLVGVQFKPCLVLGTNRCAACACVLSAVASAFFPPIHTFTVYQYTVLEGVGTVIKYQHGMLERAAGGLTITGCGIAC